MNPHTTQRPNAAARPRCLTLSALVIAWLIGQPFAAAQEPTVAIQVKAETILENQIVRRSVLFPGWDPYEAEALAAMLTPAADGLLYKVPASTRLNSPRNDGPDLIVPAVP